MAGSAGRALVEVVEAKRVLLLDFDGPICHLFSSYLASWVAETVGEFMVERGVDSASIATDDPLELLRTAYRYSSELGQEVENYLIRQEARAAVSAAPTLGAAEAVRGATLAERRVVIVSNNSERAIRAYLDRHGLTEEVPYVLGRPFAAPDQMKPDPYLIHTALELTQVGPDEAVFIGDSVTDILAGNAAKVACVGYAKSLERADRLVAADAAVIVNSMEEIAKLWT